VTNPKATKMAIWVWSLVLILALTSMALTGLNAVAKGASKNSKHAGKEVITLMSKNTLSIRGEVSVQSMSKLTDELLKMSRSLSRDETIYLVLDTPGGDVDAGNQFLDVADATPQRIDTITMRTASMGFHFAQHLGRRLILPSGTLMSHRMRVGGIAGQVPSEAETRLKMAQALADRLDKVAAARMGITLEKYKAMIRDEYWVSGQAAVDDNAADKVVLATCDKSLDGFETRIVETFLGPMETRVNRCPVTGSMAF
jgi:ATP-dependent protease ClpP protease subunit